MDPQATAGKRSRPPVIRAKSKKNLISGNTPRIRAKSKITIGSTNGSNRSLNMARSASTDNQDRKQNSTAGLRRTKTQPPTTLSIPGVKSSQKRDGSRPVSKLRPIKPIIVNQDATVFEVAKTIVENRTDVALIAGPDGNLCGILTDNDITRRVIAASKDDTIPVSEVMTRNPKCVLLDDSAMGALDIMIEGHFRHLPVVDGRGQIVGVLDIAKCLFDVITRLEQKESENKKIGANSAMMENLRRSTIGTNNQFYQLQSTMEKMFKSGIPTLDQLLTELNRPIAIVEPTTTIRETAKVMNKHRKAVLVVDRSTREENLVGILTPHDILKLVASKTSPDSTVASTVMMRNPDQVPPNTNLLDTLHHMHGSQILFLPVVEESDMTILGMVDVMDIVMKLMAKDGSQELWNAGFESSINESVRRGSSKSVPAQRRSIRKKSKSNRMVVNRGGATQVRKDSRSIRKKSLVKPSGKTGASRPVSKLRLNKTLAFNQNTTVLEVAKRMTEEHTDAALLTNNEGTLTGIVTDNDITRRIVAPCKNLSTKVSSMMTKDPTYVSEDDSALDALAILIKGKFRHLPVLDKTGSIVGILDIAKCLFDVINSLERRAQKSGNAFGNNIHSEIPTIDQALEEMGPPPMIEANADVRKAAEVITEHRKATLVLKDGDLVSIFTSEDILTKAVSKEVPLDLTKVSTLMSSNPERISPRMTLLDALHQMHDSRSLNLAIVEEHGDEIIGLLDVMDVFSTLMQCEAGQELWTAGYDDDDWETKSSRSTRSTRSTRNAVGRQPAPAYGSQSGLAQGQHDINSSFNEPEDSRTVRKLRPRKPIALKDSSTVLEVANILASKRSDAAILVGSDGRLSGIITDNDITRRVVAKFKPLTTKVSDVMTPNPTCVNSEDKALEALGTMVENHFRHLPVLDEKRSIVGVLDIAKCLFDVITRLEKKAKKSGGNALSLALSNPSAMGANKNQIMALQASLAPLLAQMFDSGIPTLRQLLDDLNREPAIINSTKNIRSGAELMAQHRKAIMIVEGRQLVGIFTPKDLLNRVVVKDINFDKTKIKTVMTTRPEIASPDMNLLEILHQMHQTRSLNFPVLERGQILGMVDVMDVINMLMKSEAGSALWSSGYDVADDVSDYGSVRGSQYGGSQYGGRSQYGGSAYSGARRGTKQQGLGIPRQDSRKNRQHSMITEEPAERTVKQLRPNKPIALKDSSTVLDVAKVLTSKRTDAAILVGPNGTLSGILTDNDVLRRVVAKFKKLSIRVSTVMTPKPQCVKQDQSAQEALGIMVKNHFRHLPVLDRGGSIVGVLDIAKCIFNVIRKIERKAKKASGQASLTNAISQNVSGASNAQMRLLEAALGPLMQELFGASGVPTLGQLLSELDRAPSVKSSSTIRSAAGIMADKRKAVMVTKNNRLVGLFTAKNLLHRCVAKELVLDRVPISSVMTRSPETATPDMTLIDALHQMNDTRFLNLPVLDSNGSILGLVDVMDVINCLMKDEAAQEIWNVGYDGSESESGSQYGGSQYGGSQYGESRYGGSVRGSVRKSPQYGTRRTSGISKQSSSRPTAGGFSSGRSVRGGKRKDQYKKSSSATQRPLQSSSQKKANNIRKHGRLVKELRPKRPVTLDERCSVLQVAQSMVESRADSALLIWSGDKLSGIITDNDITRRVVADFKPLSTPALEVMTKNPKCVSSTDNAWEALSIMAENHFRHLPVLNPEGSIVGVLDIAKCLFDVIHRLESVAKKNRSDKSGALGKTFANLPKGGNSAQLATVLGSVMEQMYGLSGIPTLGRILSEKGKPPPLVNSTINVRTAAEEIAKRRKAVLVLEDDQLVGIFTPNDVLTRVVAEERHIDLTSVSSVMTPDPNYLSPKHTILDALYMMQNERVLNIPVVDEVYGRIKGIIDVMDIIENIMTGKAGKLFWDFAQENAFDDNSSVYSFAVDNRKKDNTTSRPAVVRKPSVLSGRVEKPHKVPAEPSEIFTFKAHYGNITHRVKSEIDNFANLHSEVAKKLKIPKKSFFLTYKDCDGEEIKLDDDDALIEAVNMVKARQENSLKLSVREMSQFSTELGQRGNDNQIEHSNSSLSEQDQIWALVGVSVAVGVAVALVSFLTISMFRSSPNSHTDDKSKKK